MFSKKYFAVKVYYLEFHSVYIALENMGLLSNICFKKAVVYISSNFALFTTYEDFIFSPEEDMEL